ncbi:hypothetical protein ScPMuIL_003301 [Solemya velum]
MSSDSSNDDRLGRVNQIIEDICSDDDAPLLQYVQRNHAVHDSEPGPPSEGEEPCDQPQERGRARKRTYHKTTCQRCGASVCNIKRHCKTIHPAFPIQQSAGRSGRRPEATAATRRRGYIVRVCPIRGCQKTATRMDEHLAYHHKIASRAERRRLFALAPPAPPDHQMPARRSRRDAPDVLPPTARERSRAPEMNRRTQPATSSASSKRQRMDSSDSDPARSESEAEEQHGSDLAGSESLVPPTPQRRRAAAAPRRRRRLISQQSSDSDPAETIFNSDTAGSESLGHRTPDVTPADSQPGSGSDAATSDSQPGSGSDAATSDSQPGSGSDAATLQPLLPAASKTTAAQMSAQVFSVWQSVQRSPVFRPDDLLDLDRFDQLWFQTARTTKQPGTVKSYLHSLSLFLKFMLAKKLVNRDKVEEAMTGINTIIRVQGRAVRVRRSDREVHDVASSSPVRPAPALPAPEGSQLMPAGPATSLDAAKPTPLDFRSHSGTAETTRQGPGDAVSEQWGERSSKSRLAKMRNALAKIQHQLSEYGKVGNPGHSGWRLRGTGLSETETTVERIGLDCSSIADLTAQMEEAIKSNEADLARLEQEFAGLSETKANLAMEQRELFTSFTPHEIGRIVSQSSKVTTNKDLTREACLRDYAQEEVDKASADLKSWRDKVSSDREELTNEWSALASDLARYREAKRPYYEEIDETNNRIIGKLGSVINEETSTDDAGYESGVFQRTIDFLEGEMELRTLRENYLESQLQFRKNEKELGYLNSKKGAIWRYCLSVERLLQPEGQEELLLRPAAARSNIAVTDRTGPEVVPSEEEIFEPLHVSNTGGQLLHRCSRHTNLSVNGLTEEETTPEVNIVTAARTTHDEAAEDDSEGSNEASSGEGDENEAERENEQQLTQRFVKSPLKSTADKQSSFGADRPPETAGAGAGPSSSADPDGERFQMMTKLRKRMGVQSSSQQRFGHLKPVEAAGRTGSSTNIKPLGPSKKSRR